MDSISGYIFEAGMLKRVKRSGWWAEGITSQESVADHSFRAAIIAFVLAKMEGADDEAANRICTAAVFHDMHEARLGDMHKITARYVKVTRELELKVEREQAVGMPQALRKAVLGTLDLTETEHTILKDADYLDACRTKRNTVEYDYVGGASASDANELLYFASGLKTDVLQ